ncbi:probable ATP-dependent helicase PF08_0048 [Schistocerca americana]|uniref:probable ATP-dependent helicase PF08_0048 n=1 Tax=Schistocerca americana TaxID=7009 RepID=UPI001F501609|nr:probable ATP-dependent helicase PF08_0048 [Schistocerca americana]
MTYEFFESIVPKVESSNLIDFEHQDRSNQRERTDQFDLKSFLVNFTKEIKQSVDDNKTYWDEKIDNILLQVQAVNTQVGELSNRVGSVEEKIESVEAKVNEIDAKLSGEINTVKNELLVDRERNLMYFNEIKGDIKNLDENTKSLTIKGNGQNWGNDNFQKREQNNYHGVSQNSGGYNSFEKKDHKFYPKQEKHFHINNQQNREHFRDQNHRNFDRGPYNRNYQQSETLAESQSPVHTGTGNKKRVDAPLKVRKVEAEGEHDERTNGCDYHKPKHDSSKPKLSHEVISCYLLKKFQEENNIDKDKIFSTQEHTVDKSNCDSFNLTEFYTRAEKNNTLSDDVICSSSEMCVNERENACCENENVGERDLVTLERGNNILGNNLNVLNRELGIYMVENGLNSENIIEIPRDVTRMNKAHKLDVCESVNFDVVDKESHYTNDNDTCITCNLSETFTDTNDTHTFLMNIWLNSETISFDKNFRKMLINVCETVCPEWWKKMRYFIFEKLKDKYFNSIQCDLDENSWLFEIIESTHDNFVSCANFITVTNNTCNDMPYDSDKYSHILIETDEKHCSNKE